MFSEITTVSQERPFCLYRLRKACLEVRDAEEFHAGLLCGQAAFSAQQGKASDTYLFEAFEELFRDLEKSQTYLVGCLIGMVDALLQARRTVPRNIWPICSRSSPGVERSASAMEKETEVARVRQLIEAEHRACLWALSGLASGNAQHAYITRRMRHLDTSAQRLSLLLGEEQAMQIVCEIFEQSPPQRTWQQASQSEG